MLAFDRGADRVSASLVTRMRETLRHRGPNGGDTWVDERGRIGLGHRRLSIIDLATAASQPMANEDGTLRVIFNGEIYNHLELRAELSKSPSCTNRAMAPGSWPGLRSRRPSIFR